MKRRLVVFYGIACLAAASFGRAEEPNEDFSSASVLDAGVFTTGMQVLDDGGMDVAYPDTTLGLYNNAAYSILLRRNDNHLLRGDGKGSALTLLTVNPDGSVPLVVSGSRDLNFDGRSDNNQQPHTQAGNAQLTLIIWDHDNPGAELDRLVEDIVLAPGEFTRFPFINEDWIGHSFTAILDNTIDGGNDVDFWRFTDLAPGAMFTADIASETADLDTLMRLLDPVTGDVLAENNDAHVETYLSSIRGTVDDTGDVVFGVTSFDDFDFIGAHGGVGDYTLTLSYDGDTDLDNDVDGDDLLNLLLGFGTPAGATTAQGDADRDGDVDRDDLGIWQLNAGVGGVPPIAVADPSAGVPEPGTFALLVILLTLLVARRRICGTPQVG